MMVIDSCGWLSYLLDAPLASAFAPYVARPGVLVPALAVYEVHKVMQRERGEVAADEAANWLMETYTVVPVDGVLAVEAADYAVRHGLSLADAVMYATAKAHKVPLVTSDSHFLGLPGVEYIGDGEA